MMLVFFGSEDDRVGQAEDDVSSQGGKAEGQHDEPGAQAVRLGLMGKPEVEFVALDGKRECEPGQEKGNEHILNEIRPDHGEIQ